MRSIASRSIIKTEHATACNIGPPPFETHATRAPQGDSIIKTEHATACNIGPPPFEMHAPRAPQGDSIIKTKHAQACNIGPRPFETRTSCAPQGDGGVICRRTIRSLDLPNSRLFRQRARRRSARIQFVRPTWRSYSRVVSALSDALALRDPVGAARR